MEQVDNDEDLLRELLTIFKDSSATDMAVLRQAVDKGDAVEARRASHSIKGAAASLGLEAIRDVAWAVEKDCQGGALNGAKEKFSQLEALLALSRKL